MAVDDLNDTMEGDALSADGGQKSGGALPEFVVLLLKIIAGAIGAIILTATVSFIVFNIMQGDRPRQTLVDTSPTYRAKPEPLQWFTNLEDIRTRTSDTPPRSVNMAVILGYDQRDNRLMTELNQQTPRIHDLIRRYISSQRSSELVQEQVLKEELRNRINDILREGEVREVLFQQFDIFEN